MGYNRGDGCAHGDDALRQQRQLTGNELSWFNPKKGDGWIRLLSGDDSFGDGFSINKVVLVGLETISKTDME
jgi:hypothetical protein